MANLLQNRPGSIGVPISPRPTTMSDSHDDGQSTYLVRSRSSSRSNDRESVDHLVHSSSVTLERPPSTKDQQHNSPSETPGSSDTKLPKASSTSTSQSSTSAAAQQFCLRWNNYQTNLTSVFDQLLQNESFVDVTLACDGSSIKAHKMVLSACSPYFQSLFFDNPCQHPIIIMRDIKWPELKAAVEFMYKGEINVSQAQIGPLLRVAEMLKIRGLADVNGDPELATATAAAEMSPNRTTSTPTRNKMDMSSSRSGLPYKKPKLLSSMSKDWDLMSQLASSVASGLDVAIPRQRKRRWPSTETASVAGSPIRNNSSITPDHTIDHNSPVPSIPTSLLSTIVSSAGPTGLNVHPSLHLREQREQQLHHQAQLQHQAHQAQLQQNQQHPQQHRHQQQQQQHQMLHQDNTTQGGNVTHQPSSSSSGTGSGERGSGNSGGPSGGSSSTSAPFIHPAPIEAMTIGAMTLPNHPDDMEIKPGIAEMIREEERVSVWFI